MAFDGNTAVKMSLRNWWEVKIKKKHHSFLDLSKMFYTLDHGILLRKLDKYVIRGNALNWFKSYFNNRNMNVKILNGIGSASYSESHEVPIGALQGSGLGPLLFLIYTNDLHNSIKYTSCILFADDTTLYYVSKYIRYLKWCIECDLLSLSKWFKAHELTLNLDKHTYVHIHCKGSKIKLNLEVNRIYLLQSSSTKFLGIWIDEDLNWNCHVSKLICKLNHNTHLLQSSKNLLPPQVVCSSSKQSNVWPIHLGKHDQQNQILKVIKNYRNVSQADHKE